MKGLLTKGKNIESEQDKWTPLHCALKTVNIEIVKMLLSRGANIEAKDVNACTPLHYAAVRAHKK